MPPAAGPASIPDGPRGSVDRRDRLTLSALFAAALAVYVVTSSAHLAGGDSPELVTIFARGGVPHPPGYPLYCVLLRSLAWMPGGAILGSSRVSAILGALSVAALYRACRAWGASRAASLVSVAAYASSPLAWRLSTEAEVFALNGLLAALLLHASAPGVAMDPARRVVLLAGLAGLGLSNHLTIVFLAPIGILAATRAFVASRARTRTALLAGGSFCAGLLPYLYCYEVGRAPGGRYVWGDPGTLGGLLHHVLRADYGTFNLTGADEALHPLANVESYFTQTASDVLVVPLLLGLYGFWRLYARTSATGARGGSRAAPHLPDTGDALALAATWALCGPVFAALLNVSPDAPDATLVERFRLLPEAVLVIAAAWGIDAWRALAEGRAVPRALASVVIVAAAAVHSWPRVRAEHTDALERYTENTERSAPPRAVLLGTGDYRLFSFLYADAIHLRPDVTYVDPHLLGYEWYRARIGRELGVPVAPPASTSANAPLALAAQAFALGRPVLLTNVFDAQVVRALPSYPIGTLIRLLPPGAAVPAPESVERENIGVFESFQRWSAIEREDAWAQAVLPTYRRPWVALARLFERRGDEGRAKANRERADEWGGGGHGE